MVLNVDLQEKKQKCAAFRSAKTKQQKKCSWEVFIPNVPTGIDGRAPPGACHQELRLSPGVEPGGLKARLYP